MTLQTDVGATLTLSEPRILSVSDVHRLDYSAEKDLLQSLIKQVDEKISEEWLANELQQRVNQLLQQNEDQMTKYTLQFEELVKRYEDLKKLKTDAATEVKNKNAELEQHRKQLETAQKDLEQLLRTRETLHEILEKLSAEVKKEESVLREQEKETKESSVELEEALEFFRNRLALQMKKIPDNRLQFVFTCIDKDDPKKPFCFCVKIKADRSYCVSDCVPHVPDFEKLSLKLNETNDFKAFVKAMWKRFKLAA